MKNSGKFRFSVSRLVLAGTAVFGASLMPAPVWAETLQDALVAAYSTNPVLTGQRAALRATDEGVSQANSNWRPTVSISGSAGVDQREVDPANTDETLNPLSASLNATQPIYRGGRTLAETAAAEAAVKGGRSTLRDTEQSVLLSVVTAYMDVIRDQAVVQLSINNEKVLQRQLQASKDRFDVGEVTRTDVAQAEARLSRAVSSRQSAEGDLIASKATYRRVVGRDPGQLEPPPPLPGLPQGEAEAVDAAISENPRVQAAVFDEERTRNRIRQISGELLPTVDLVGALSYSEEATTPDVDVTTASIRANVTVPLYQSGSVYSRTRQARQENNQARIAIEDARRTARESATQAWEDLATARAQIESNEQQVRANKIALEGVTQEAQVGSRTTLDVLDAEQELLDSQVAVVRAERDEYVAAFALLSAVGQLSAEQLGLPVELYDPAENYNRVRSKAFGTDGGFN